MTISRFITVIILCLALTGTADAKWWIFGEANEEVGISYLYLNDISYDESGSKLTVYRDMLTGGELILRGKARVGKGKIGGVSISLDNRGSWQDAQFTTDGGFEFRFRPETDRTYVMYVEVMDSAGKANDVDKTRKEVTVTAGSGQKQVREVLDAMVAAYRAEDPTTFMTHVSDSFVADPVVLDRAIRKDFSLFDNINLRYTVNNVASGNGGMFVAIGFNRQLTSTRSGKSFSDRGVTEFVFKPSGTGFKLFSMKFPLIFGLSDSSEVATGTVTSGGNEQVIIVTADGTVTTKPANEVIAGKTEPSTVVSGSNITVTSLSHPPAGFDFAAGETNANGTSFFITGGDAGYVYGFLAGGHGFKDLGTVPLSSVNEAPADGYTTGSNMGYNLRQGHTYAFRLPDNTYALMEIISAGTMHVPTYAITMKINYKYQAGGGRNF